MSNAPPRKNLILVAILVVCVGVVAWQLWSWLGSGPTNSSVTSDPPPAVGGGSRVVK